ncbi:MAG: chromosomal replication initiator protein DnaA [Hydrogenophaga sp.]|uniref:chromosomal replication initiator protein DnaA n=1 Tax=Hydrogenophaga sp. TaxID=1904254 RepID=UPI0027300011|nr:chromosomal replication initiator protein DnaA [Hydrogenophaga sp.]MDP2166611.1 chromosomal replication initiator protein DnaA [Hydrogenophaga sp.]
MAIWPVCLERLQDELPQNLFNMWIRPLQAEERAGALLLLAPNTFFVRHIADKYLARIRELVTDLSKGVVQQVLLEVGNRQDRDAAVAAAAAPQQTRHTQGSPSTSSASPKPEAAELPRPASNLNPLFLFDSFVAGKSNQLAFAACQQVAEKPGITGHNPLFIYGPTGLGKTHLMHSVGNAVLRANPGARILYLTSERFVQDFITALQRGMMSHFKNLYRSLDVLLIDDIQFFAGKGSSQEEFFHTFNALLEGSRQVILTSDKFPREINELDERLKSRFAWGLTLQVEPPELETRTAILMKKAEQNGIPLPQPSAFFIAQHVQANVRELEGALNKVIATARFKGRPIELDMVKESLKDILAVRAKQINIENIQKVVAEYYRIPLRELTGKKRNRSYARPRQVAMSLARELTGHSYPEIGHAFDGRDHSTVIHACDKIDDLKKSDPNMVEDYNNLLRLLQA